MSAALVAELRAEVESLRELARGATATALAMTAERDALRGSFSTALASVRQLRADVELATRQRDEERCRADDAEAVVETMRTEHAMLREIIEGRATPPTRESFIALGATGGTVRYRRPDGGHGWFPASDPWWGAVVSLCREGARMWAHAADGRPCAWPTVTP